VKSLPDPYNMKDDVQGLCMMDRIANETDYRWRILSIFYDGSILELTPQPSDRDSQSDELSHLKLNIRLGNKKTYSLSPYLKDKDGKYITESGKILKIFKNVTS
jgi:hypothetical protein